MLSTTARKLVALILSALSAIVVSQYHPYPYQHHQLPHHGNSFGAGPYHQSHGAWPNVQWADTNFYPGVHSPSEKLNSRSDSGFGLKHMTIPNDLADKLFPFTIRIASHGEPHLPIVRVGHHPFTLGAGLWGKPELQYGKHVHHHNHHLSHYGHHW